MRFIQTKGTHTAIARTSNSLCHTEFENYIRKLNFARGFYTYFRANANIYGFVRRENVELLCLWQELLCFFILFRMKFCII